MRKNKDESKIFILPNLQLLIMGIILLIITVVPCIAMIIIEDSEEIQGLFAFLSLAMIAAMLYSSPKYTLSIEIDLENQVVTRKAWFTKTSVKYISEYKYVYEADYYNRGIRPKYIIIATEPVDEIYLTNVNNLPLSENVIAMEYSEKRRNTVKQICGK